MKINCKLTLEFDNKKIIANISSTSIGSILHTLDDYLACISVAEKIAQSNK